MSALSPAAGAAAAAPGRRPVSPWWVLAALTVLAAALRLSTLNLQSFWYDEAFTPVHVLHPGLVATLRSVVHTENTPPLWYLIAWADSRILGDGEIALRLPSALAGIASVPVAWAIGQRLGGRGAAVVCAALLAVDPIFVWYSQEARAYELFVLSTALALLCLLRALEQPSPRRLALFTLCGALALLSQYFAVFLLIPMVLWLLARVPEARRGALAASAGIAVVGLALLPLISAQGGHGTQWIGRWPLGQRLQAIPQYFLTGYNGAALGHGVELLVALPMLAAAALGVWRMLERRRGEAVDVRERRGALLTVAIAACAILLPLVLAVAGADYLAPRNLVGAMVAVAALIAVLAAWPGNGPLGLLPGTLMCVALLAVTIDTDLSPRLQRGDWRGLVQAIGGQARGRAIVTVELGSAPLEYYLSGLHGLHRGQTVRVREVDETGYAPLVAGAGRPPAPGFHLLARDDVNGLIVYRFQAAQPTAITETQLRLGSISLAGPEVLVGPGVSVQG